MLVCLFICLRGGDQKRLAGTWLDIARITCTRGTTRLELGNTHNDRVYCAWMVVNAIRFLKIVLVQQWCCVKQTGPCYKPQVRTQ